VRIRKRGRSRLEPRQAVLGGYRNAWPMTVRRFPAPWKVVETGGGDKVADATGQALAYF